MFTHFIENGVVLSFLTLYWLQKKMLRKIGLKPPTPWEGEVQHDKGEQKKEGEGEVEQMVNCNCAEIFLFISSHTTSKHNPHCCCIEKI